MKKMILKVMVMMMVIMSVATGCANETNVEETRPVKLVADEETKSLDTIISENIMEYVYDENLYFDNKEVTISTEGNDIIVDVMYTYEGHPSGYQMFRVCGVLNSEQ